MHPVHPLISDLEAAGSGPLRFAERESRGLSRGRLRNGSTWRRLGYGLYTPAGSECTISDQARAFSRVLPEDSGFGHLTGAALRGWWMPHRLGPHVVFATTRTSLHAARAGLYVRRSPTTEFDHPVTAGGLRCVSAADTLVELARDLTLVDLVPMVDQALAGGTTTEQIAQRAHRRQHGAPVLRQALALADPRSESWWESVLRLQHVLVGLGPVDCQVEIRDQDSCFVARADLHLVGTRRYPECDGGEHRDRQRHLQDLRRDKSLARLGLERYGYTTEEICHQPQVIIRDAERARGQAPDPTRLRRWLAVAATSSLTAFGRARLTTRLARYGDSPLT